MSDEQVPTQEQPNQQEEQPTPQQQANQAEQELIAGKYKNVDAIIEANKAGERKISELGEENKKLKEQISQSSESVEIPEKAEPEPESGNIFERAGITQDEFASYVVEHGNPSEEHLKAIVGKTITPDDVSALAKMVSDTRQVASQAQEVSSRHHRMVLEQEFGGKENVDAIRSWASENLTDKEIASINKSLSDPDSFITVFAGLAARSGISTQSRPNLIRGTGPAQAATFTGTNMDLVKGLRSNDPTAVKKLESMDAKQFQI